MGGLQRLHIAWIAISYAAMDKIKQDEAADSTFDGTFRKQAGVPIK